MKRNVGITLIALVVTIIITLILAGISLNLVLGENGIMTKAKQAKEVYQKASNEEQEMFTNLEEAILSGEYGGNSNTETGSSSTENGSTGSTEQEGRQAKEIPYTWDELAEIAKQISSNSSVTNETKEVEVSANGKKDTIGVGDTTTISYNDNNYTVRILGFNHDELVKNYDGSNNTTGVKAGISFEFVDYLTQKAINDSDGTTNTNIGGWGECTLRTELNGTTYQSIINSAHIKQVKKVYNTGNQQTTTKTSQDYLWLLSASEIFDLDLDTNRYGMMSLSKEGDKYEFYAQYTTRKALNNAIYKRIRGGDGFWTLRSPSARNDSGYCQLCGCFAHYHPPTGDVFARAPNYITPGFAI